MLSSTGEAYLRAVSIVCGSVKREKDKETPVHHQQNGSCMPASSRGMCYVGGCVTVPEGAMAGRDVGSQEVNQDLFLFALKIVRRSKIDVDIRTNE